MNYVEAASKQVRKHKSDELKLLLTNNKDFQQDVLALRKRFGIPPNGFEMYVPLDNTEQSKTKYVSTKPNPTRAKFYKTKAWKEAVRGLLFKHNLRLEYYNVLDLYLFSNDYRYFEPDFFLLPSGNMKWTWRFYDTSQGVRMRREIVITGHLTEKEYKALKSLQNEVFGNRKRRRARKNIDRDIEIVQKSQHKDRAGYRSDREMADHISAFQDEGESIASLRGLSRRQANVIKQARRRLKGIQTK